MVEKECSVPKLNDDLSIILLILNLFRDAQINAKRDALDSERVILQKELGENK